MALTSTQLATLKSAIQADVTLSAYPNNSDGNFAIASAMNLNAVPDFYVWQTAVAIDEITDAIAWDKMTPAAVPDGTATWTNRALHAQGKQFNLQNLLIGRATVNASRSNIRAAFQDCLTQLPTKADGTNQAAGWAAVQLVMSRKAKRIEQLLATGTGTQANPGMMGFEGTLTYQDVEQARNS